MSKSYKLVIPFIVFIAVLALAVDYFRHHSVAVLSTHGQIANQERSLIFFAAGLSLLVIVPVFAMTIGIAWRYREGNKKAKYTPDWDHNRVAEAIWWIVPTILILILSVVTWRSSHQLDPFKPISSKVKPLTVQVVALQWKWLFIYPEQNVAAVNYLVIPTNTPINFEVTADAPMNSFWIPQLSGQIYAMSGMSTQLHLITDTLGSYTGRSANISGDGFASMQFTTRAVSPLSFSQWVGYTKQSTNHLTTEDYQRLAEPSSSYPVTYYASSQNYLYNKIVFKTAPDSKPENGQL